MSPMPDPPELFFQGHDLILIASYRMANRRHKEHGAIPRRQSSRKEQPKRAKLTVSSHRDGGNDEQQRPKKDSEVTGLGCRVRNGGFDGIKNSNRCNGGIRLGWL
jgi:hypothetical protein